jgi:uncharacterized membrane protein YphA (DoxX/SURF4 family)
MSAKNLMASSTSAGLGLLLARLPVGAILALTGYRILRKTGTAEFMLDNLNLVMTHLSEGPARTYLNLFPYVCIILGLTLVFGALTRPSGLLGAALLVSLAYFRAGMTGFVNPNPAYAYQLLNAPTVYTLFAMVVFFAGPGKLSLDHFIFKHMRAKELKEVNAKYGRDAFSYGP